MSAMLARFIAPVARLGATAPAALGAVVPPMLPWRAFSAAAAAEPAPSVPSITPLAAAAPSATTSSASEGAASAARPAPTKLRFKNGFKRASATMAEVRAEQIWMMNKKVGEYRPPLSDFNVGDAVQIEYALDHSDKVPTPIRGVVIGKRNRGMDSAFTILNAMDDEWYSATYPYSSPLLRAVKVMRRNHHSDGTKRARRARLNFLFDREHKTYAVDHTTRESADILREKKERKEVQKLGKIYIKPKTGPGVGAAAAAAAAGGAAAGAKGGAAKGGKAAGGAKAKK